MAVKRETNEKLREAFAAAAREEADRMEREVADIPLPDAFPALTLPHAEKIRRFPLRRVIAAGVAAALLLVFLVVPVSAGGKTAATYLIEQFEKGSFFHPKKNGQDAPDSIVTFYTVDAPERYTLLNRESISALDKITTVISIWEVGGKRISLKQTLIGIKFTVDTENAAHEKIDRNGYTVYYYYKNGVSYALWMTEDYQFFLLADDTDRETFFAIMDTLRELTPEELETFDRA